MAKMIKLRSALAFLQIVSVLCISLAAAAAAYTPVDNYLISCGSSVDTPVGRRLFVADDSDTVVLTSPASAAVKASPSAVSGLGDADAAMYQSARVFTAPSSYAFRIRSPGRHFVRLHFFPFVYRGYDLATARFKVSTQDAVLIDSFSPATSPTPTPACEEFLLDVSRDTLVVTFVPLAGAGGLAFVNAVEVVSVPDTLTGAADSSLSTSNSIGQQLNPAVMPLQTVYRVNVGGPAVAAENDTLCREWTIDQPFLVATVTSAVTREVAYSGTLNYLAGQATAEDAPAIVYATGRELIMNSSATFDGMKQMTWQFDVNGSASYLIRFHFCDIVSSVPGLLHMNAYIDSSQTIPAIQDLDLSAISNGVLAFPYYRDYVLATSSASGKLAVYVGSSANKITTPAAILNGLEIMKILTNTGSVVVVEPTAPATNKKKNLAVVLGSVCGAFAFVSVAAALVIVLRKKKDDKNELRTPSTSQPSTAWMPLLGRISFRSAPTSAVASATPSFTIDTNTPGAATPMAATSSSSPSPSYRFPFATLQEATGNFDEGLVIGEGGFGKVYAAVLPDGGGATKVAVKRANPESRQGAREFRTEIEMLSGLRHRHLVSLIGYCDEHDEMILLYEYMEHGSLRSRLYGNASETTLTWPQRLEACVGAARGLLYLHAATSKPVIHRDVKSSNILLDGGLTAKVADFGLSKAGPDTDETHVSTAVKGSFGYVDPEYVRTRKLTAKSDVYSFGVVLLEVLCARPVVDPRLPKPMVSLVEWGLHWQGRDELERIVDRRIAGAVRPAALRKYGETVARCLADRGVDRPAMEDVVWSLQFVTRLQEVDGLDVSDVSSLNMVHQLTPPSHARRRSADEGETGRGDDDEEGGSCVADDEYTDASMRGIFWQMVNVRGR